MSNHHDDAPKRAVIFRRYRRLKNGRLLDAHDYGYEAWPILIRRGR